ncbi:MAG: amidohydrolase [Gemmatimonadota bacterium]
MRKDPFERTAEPSTPGDESFRRRRRRFAPRSASRVLAACAVVVAAALVAACAPEGPTADLVLTNGKVVTMDANGTEAEAVAIAGDTIAAVGSTAEIDALVGDGTRVIDLDGSLATPGFIEGHGHFMGLGDALSILDLTEAESWSEIVGLVEEAVDETEPGTWIRGRGWHQDKWTETPSPAVEGLPVHSSLSEVSPDNPVILGHASGHASFVNERALELAGVDADTPDPEGGEIVRDSEGRPTGALRENAQDLVSRVAGQADSERSEEDRRAEREHRAELAAREALSKGITTFHDAGVSFETVEFYRSLVDEGRLPLRLYVMVRASSEELDGRLSGARVVGYGDDRLTVRSIKRSLDGALGSHGAWLLEPYEDLERSSGLPSISLEELERTAELAVEHDYQLNVHAIGDRANRAALDVFEDAFARASGEGDLRWRIEHAQHIHPDDIPRFAELGVIASMQALHACSDAPWVPDRIGMERAREGAYVWRRLWETGAVVTNGTDAPVEDVDPLPSYQCTVARTLPSGDVFFEGQEDQRLTRMEALRSYTVNNAHAAFEEDLKGSLEPGKLADVTVFSDDILTVPVEEITSAEVLYTIVGGEVEYERNGDGS